MGDGEKAHLQLEFNPKVRLEFHGSTITSDAGLLAFPRIGLRPGSDRNCRGLPPGKSHRTEYPPPTGPLAPPVYLQPPGWLR